jgi:hypothetical protein
MRTLKNKEDKKILDELENTFVQQIMMEFLFVDFLYIFKQHFQNQAEEMEEANIYENTPGNTARNEYR